MFFTTASGSEGPRCGEFMGKVATPCASLPTQRGLPFYLTNDNLAKVKGTDLLQMPLGDMLVATGSMTNQEQVTGKSFFNTGDRITYLSYRNPLVQESVFGGETLTVDTPAGRKKASPQDVLAAQKQLRFDIVTSPAEEVPSEAGIGNKRPVRSVEKAEKFLAEMLSAKEAGDLDAHLLANLQGGLNMDQRKKAATSAAATAVDGFVIGGLGYGEKSADRQAVLETTISCLPAERPRFLPCTGCPVEILQAVCAGVDIIEATFPIEAAKAGIAITFRSDAEVSVSEGSVDEKRALFLEQCQNAPKAPPKKPTKQKGGPKFSPRVDGWWNTKTLDLTSEACRESLMPIQEDSVVKQYTQAYLFHLFQCKELTGNVLLMMHNLEVYGRFFEAIRKHIAAGTFFDFALQFLREQTDMLDENVAAPEEPEVEVEAPAKRRKLSEEHKE